MAWITYFVLSLLSLCASANTHDVQITTDLNPDIEPNTYTNMLRTVGKPPVFRLGSGAGSTDSAILATQFTSTSTLKWISVVLSFCTAAAILGHMMDSRGGHRSTAGGAIPQMSPTNFNYRIPPGWGPEHSHHYSFRAWYTDLRLWSMITDLTPSAQAAAVVIRLCRAREVACEL